MIIGLGELNDGEPNDLCWEHWLEYECTALRRVFLDEMARPEPGWVSIFNSSTLYRDLDFAVLHCDSELCVRDIHARIDDVTAGKTDIQSLQDRW
jgi:hypothetical protein